MKTFTAAVSMKATSAGEVSDKLLAVEGLEILEGPEMDEDEDEDEELVED